MADAVAQVELARNVTQLGMRRSISQCLVAANKASLRQTVAHLVPPAAPGAEVGYLRVYMELESGDTGSWYLTIRDQNLRPIEVLTPESFLPGRGRWTTRVKGSRVLFDLDLADSAPETTATRISLKEYIAMPAKAQTPYYSSQVPDEPSYRDLYDLAYADEEVGDTVGFVMGSYDQESWCCSGVVVGNNLLLTNWHCGGKPNATHLKAYWGPRACQDTIVDLSWDGDKVSREFRCAEVLCRNRDLDFALLRIAPLGTDRVAKPARTRLSPPTDGEPLTVIHHPECRPKQITDGCAIVSANYRGWMDESEAADFSHRCDTEGGSSGGAVFDGSGQLIGLHHTGFGQTGDAEARGRSSIRRCASIRS